MTRIQRIKMVASVTGIGIGMLSCLALPVGLLGDCPVLGIAGAVGFVIGLASASIE